MAREFTNGFYSSAAWIKCREGFMESKLWICQMCGLPGANTAHHIIHINEENINDPEVTLNWKNLMALHHDCHNKIHGKHQEVCREDVMFDPLTGQLIKRKQ